MPWLAIALPTTQGNVKVQGMCIFFLIMPLAQTWLIRHE